jgi:hypothetical protein
MAFSERSLDDYVDVAQRIADFRALYPDGSLQPADPAKPWEQAIVSGVTKNGEPFTATMIVYTAAAYRTPEDIRPGIGIAWEVFPGRTPYTLGSELMNAETSAWGRAIVAVLASDSKRGVASRQEVEARRAEREDGLPTNADGSLSRSRTSDDQKAAAGVMTSAQQAEHTGLRAGADGRTPAAARRAERVDSAGDDVWTDQPAGTLPTPPEDKPGSIGPGQERRLFALARPLGIVDRGDRMKLAGEVTGREVLSWSQLSMIEADALIRHLEDKAKEAAK